MADSESGHKSRDDGDKDDKTGALDVLEALGDALVNGGLRAGWRAMTSDGQGAFLAAMLLFGIAAYAFHYGLEPQLRRETRLEQAASDRQQPLEGERYPLLASLVSPRHDGPLLCPARATKQTKEAIDDQKVREALRNSLRQALNSVTAKFTARAKALYANSEARPALRPLCGSTTPHMGTAWTEGAKGVRPASASTLFIPSTLALRANMLCGQACSEAPHDDCLAPAGDALISEFSRPLAVASALDSLVEDPSITPFLAFCKPSGAPGDEPGICKPTGDAVSRAPATGDQALISSIYFISPEGITRTLPRFAADGTLAQRMSNGATYVSEALSSKPGDVCGNLHLDTAAPAVPLDGVVTYPYLDLFGSGLVETYCTPIGVDVEAAAGSDAQPWTLGVLCADLRHPEADVIAGLQQASEALDLTVVRVSDKPGVPPRRGVPGAPPVTSGLAKVEARTAEAAPPVTMAGSGSVSAVAPAKVAGSPSPPASDTAELRWPDNSQVIPCEAMLGGKCPHELETFSSWSELAWFAMVYYDKVTSDRHSLRPGGVFVDGRGADSKFAAVVFQGDDYHDIVIGRLRATTARDYAALILTGICTLLGIAILANGNRNKMARREAYLARGLAYGLLQLGTDDIIVGANDRAESQLDAPLPRLALFGSRANCRNTFSGFIDCTQCIMIPIAGPLNKRCIVDYDHIRRRSIDGLTTDFYAYVKSLKTRTWIRVSTRIVMLPDKTEDLFYALDSQVSAEHMAFLAGLHA